MIVLDTNVLSELLRPTPEPRVVSWIRRHAPSALFTTTLSQAEMLFGVATMPAGRRRRTLEAAVPAIFAEEFGGRVLAFDGSAAVEFSRIAAARRASGRPVAQLDAMIAAIAASRGAGLATRNVKDFDGIGLVLINPWED